MKDEEKVAATMTSGSSVQQTEDVHVVKKVHADGHVDLVDAHAIGGAAEDMPKGYYYSIQFLGTVTVRSLLGHHNDFIQNVD
jgi:hypothetical protein